MTVNINQIQGIVQGQYGEPIVLQVVDYLSNPVDISSYTTLTVYLRDPWTLVTKTYTASFTTNGTDGKFQFTPAQGDLDRIGTWEVQLKLAGASLLSYSQVAQMPLEKNLG